MGALCIFSREIGIAALATDSLGVCKKETGGILRPASKPHPRSNRQVAQLAKTYSSGSTASAKP
jgi:hypothetical protein